jgi:hypothetical protein
VREIPLLPHIYSGFMNVFVAFVMFPVSTGIIFACIYNVHRDVKVWLGRFTASRRLCSEVRAVVRSWLQVIRVRLHFSSLCHAHTIRTVREAIKAPCYTISSDSMNVKAVPICL